MLMLRLLEGPVHMLLDFFGIPCQQFCPCQYRSHSVGQTLGNRSLRFDLKELRLGKQRVRGREIQSYYFTAPLNISYGRSL